MRKRKSAIGRSGPSWEELFSRVQLFTRDDSLAIVEIASQFGIENVEMDDLFDIQTQTWQPDTQNPGIVGPKWFVALVEHCDRRLSFDAHFQRWLLPRFLVAMFKEYEPATWEALYALRGDKGYAEQLKKSVFRRYRDRAADEHARECLKEQAKHEADEAIALAQVRKKYPEPPTVHRPRSLSKKG